MNEFSKATCRGEIYSFIRENYQIKHKYKPRNICVNFVLHDILVDVFHESQSHTKQNETKQGKKLIKYVPRSLS